MVISEYFNDAVGFLLPQLWELNTETSVTVPSPLSFTFLFFTFIPLICILPQFIQIWKYLILIPTSDSAFVWSGYCSLILILEFSSVIEVSLAKLFRTSFRVALKLALVWVLYLFKYFSSWFFFRWTWNYNLPLLSQNNSNSNNGQLLYVTIEVVLV